MKLLVQGNSMVNFNINFKASAGPWDRPQQTDQKEERSSHPFRLHNAWHGSVT